MMSESAEPLSRSLTWKELRDIVRLTRMQVSTLEKRGEFPRRIQVGGRRVVWPENEIRTWMAGRRVGA